jgi:hypothetical protein
MDIIFLFYGGIAVVALLSWFIWDKRYRRNHGDNIPPGYVSTSEVSIDPISGKQLRVYYNPQTGNRFYHEE